MRRTLRRISIAMTFTALSSCGFFTSFDEFSVESDAGSVAQPYDVFVDSLATALCERSRFCEAKSASASAAQVACTHVPESDALSLHELRLLSIGPHGRDRFDATSAAACVAAVAESGCALDSLSRACDFLAKGNSPDDALCSDDTACTSGRCDGTTLSCSSRSCVALGMATEACAEDHDCVAGLRCSAAVCRAPTAQAIPCSARDECANGLWCDDLDGSGECSPIPDAEGEPCGVQDGMDPCANRLLCIAGVCARGATVGASCGAASPCEPGARCVAAACRTIGSSGDVCVSRNDCPNYFDCVDDRCVPRPVAGEACSPTRECLVGRCESNVCRVPTPGATCVDAILPYAPRCVGTCDPTYSPHRCSIPIGVGAECTSDVSCASGYCVGSPARTCAACGGP